MDSKFGLRNAREQSRARKKILRTLLTEQSEGNVMDVQGFVKLFGGDGVIRAGVKAFRGEKLPSVVYLLCKPAPDVHRVLHRVHVIGNVVANRAVGPRHFHPNVRFPPGVIKGNSAKLDVPGADFCPWKTARLRTSIGTSTSTLCSNKWAYSLTSRPRSKAQLGSTPRATA
jgi:hypothetical protein